MIQHRLLLILFIALPTALCLPFPDYDQPTNLGKHPRICFLLIFNDDSSGKSALTFYLFCVPGEQFRSDALPYAVKSKFAFKSVPMDDVLSFGQVTVRGQHTNKREKESQEKLDLKLLERILKEGNIRRNVLDGKEFFG